MALTWYNARWTARDSNPPGHLPKGYPEPFAARAVSPPSRECNLDPTSLRS